MTDNSEMIISTTNQTSSWDIVTALYMIVDSAGIRFHVHLFMVFLLFNYSRGPQQTNN